MEIFDIKGEDIAKLSDGDLKKLVGLLCETEFRFSNLSVHGVHWGGDQDAPDGGADVLVDSKKKPTSEYIPSTFTVFQVKKPKMSLKSIGVEMRPKDILKPMIAEAIRKNGAYIIISSSDNTTSSAYRNRLEAMKKQVESEKSSENLILDFYDQSRLASWVRSHPSVVIWVRNRIDKDFQGWKPYDNWPYMATENEYLFDDRLKLKSGKDDHDGLSALEGIQKLRSELKKERSSVRLTGLSGVGKTRLAQALFEKEVGSDALNKSKVIYTDMSLSPAPAPVNMAEYLVSQNSNSILIVDNCLPQLHNQLTQVCKKQQSKLSLITIEYDVKDDLPDETDVYILEPSSEELIQKLIEKRFETIQYGIVRQIAKFSGGNARLAIALAHTFKKHDSISELKDEDLFERLFYQRNILDEDLLKVAEVCALVYSFDGEDTHAESELKVLSTLSDLKIIVFYKKVSELKSRELIQERSKWRAILPHALANRLAKRALSSVPIDFINTSFLNQQNQRLLKSFSKRLGYLHDFKPAQKIVDDWLDNWLANPSEHDPFQNEIFQNIAPVDQGKTLEVIEKMGSRLFDLSNKNFNDHYRILRLLAYEEEFFDRSVSLLIRMILTERPRRYFDQDKDNLIRLFKPYLSGTKASSKIRLEVIDKALKSNDDKLEELGIEMLKATLDTPPFTGAHDYDFGSRPRDYGFYPKNRVEIKSWYRFFIDYFIGFSGSNSVKKKLKKLLGEKLSNLIAYSGLHQEIPELIRSYNNNAFWFECWVSINRAIDIHKNDMPVKLKESLREVRSEVGPKTLTDRVETYVLSSGYIHCEDLFDLDEDIKAIDKHDLLQEEAFNIGSEAADTDLVDKIEYDLSLDKGRALVSFGMGLATSKESRKKNWERIKKIARNSDGSKTSLQILNGFIREISNTKPEKVGEFLEEILNEKSLKRFYVSSECNAGINKISEGRILRALNDLEIPTYSFTYLAWGRSHEPLSDSSISKICKLILARDNGVFVSLEILYMRLTGKKKISKILKEIGKQILLSIPHEIDSEETNGLGSEDHKLAELVTKCLDEDSSAPIVEELARRERKIESEQYLRFENTEYLSSMAKIHPISFLNGFLLNEADNPMENNLTQVVFSYSRNPIEQIDQPVLGQWVLIDPKSRFPILFYLRKGYYIKDGDADWIPLVYDSINQDYGLEETLKAVEYSSYSHSSISGGGSDYDLRIKLASRLVDHHNDQVSQWAQGYVKRLKKSQEDEVRREEEFSKRRNLSFE